MARIQLGPSDPLEPLIRADPGCGRVMALEGRFATLDHVGASAEQVHYAEERAERAYGRLARRATQRAAEAKPAQLTPTQHRRLAARTAPRRPSSRARRRRARRRGRGASRAAAGPSSDGEPRRRFAKSLTPARTDGPRASLTKCALLHYNRLRHVEGCKPDVTDDGGGPRSACRRSAAGVSLDRAIHGEDARSGSRETPAPDRRESARRPDSGSTAGRAAP